MSLLITREIIDIIVQHTNEEIDRNVVSVQQSQNYHCKTNALEMKAVLGLMYLSGVQKSAHLNPEELYSNRFGHSLFQTALSLRHFQFLLSCLRFDNKNTRNEQSASDKFAPIREIWELFTHNCKELYTPFEYCTVDEQLLNFRGNRPFHIYLASKPGKYRIKVIMLNDSKTLYMVNAIPYTGNVPVKMNDSVPPLYVRKLSGPIHGTGRNITADNRFSSLLLFELMLTNFNWQCWILWGITNYGYHLSSWVPGTSILVNYKF